MEIYLDGMPILGRKTGIGYYVQNLFSHLKRISNEDNFHLIGNGFGRSKIIKTDHGDLKRVAVPYDYLRTSRLKSLYDKISVDFFVNNMDLYHGTNYTLLPTNKAKKVVTIHDLSFINAPQHLPPQILNHHREWVEYSVKKADAIIVDSEIIKNELCQFYGVNHLKVHPIYLASSEILNKYDPLYSTKLHLPDQYVLYVGTVESRKNIVGLISGYTIAKKKHGFDHKLVIAGGPGYKYGEIETVMNELKNHEDVIFTGYVSDEDLAVLYSKATLFVYVSFYEGFGIPLVDAMQFGLPIITSNLSSMPEVVGEAGTLVNPYDVEDIADKIGLMISNPSTNKEKIIEQASKFCWTKTAKETCNVYHSIQ